MVIFCSETNGLLSNRKRWGYVSPSQPFTSCQTLDSSS